MKKDLKLTELNKREMSRIIGGKSAHCGCACSCNCSSGNLDDIRTAAEGNTYDGAKSSKAAAIK